MRIFPKSILLLFALLFSASSYGKDFVKEFDPVLATNPALSPEECAKQCPDQMHERLEAEYLRLQPGDPSRVDGIYSMGGADGYYLTYAHQIQKRTDQDYPQLKAFRRPHLKSLRLCVEYLAEIGINVKHEDDRVSARVEWMLFQGARTDYRYVNESHRGGNGDHRPELIEQIGVAIGRANVNTLAFPFDSEMRPILKECLASLAEAERHMTKPQKLFFRRRLALFMTGYL